MWFFDSEALARKVIDDAIQIDIEPDPQHDPPWRIKLSRETGHKYDFYAYKMFPCCFVDGRQEHYVLPSLNCEPLPADYERLGYDAVNRTGCPHFECGPLFCNGTADEIAVNRFCLIDEPQRALDVARTFSGRTETAANRAPTSPWKSGAKRPRHANRHPEENDHGTRSYWLSRSLHPSRATWLQTPAVEEVCTVVAHIPFPDRLRPENWYHQHRHNALRHFDSEEIAWTVLRDEIHIRLERDDSLDPPWRVEIARLPVEKFDLYAFKVLPVRFVNGEQEKFVLPELRIAPIPADYERLGYDAVGWNNWAPFECSPLICNGEAVHQSVNRYCLFDEMGPALELARRYSGTRVATALARLRTLQPGPYCVVEVWRKAKPFPEPARCGTTFEWSPDLLRRLLEHKLAHGNVFDR